MNFDIFFFLSFIFFKLVLEFMHITYKYVDKIGENKINKKKYLIYTLYFVQITNQ